MDWSRDWLSARATILLPALVAVLSFLTGVANITSPLGGALGTLIPPSFQQAAGFTGALTGFSLLLGIVALRRRLRLGWWVTIVLLPVSAFQGVVQSSPLSAPLVVLSLISLPTLLVNRHRFDRGVDLSTAQLAAGAALLGAQVYGTVGTWALREEFNGVGTLTDAFYFTLVTASTVGYGDITPQSERATLFGMSVVVIGTASFAIALGSLLGPAIEKRFSEVLGTMSDAQLELLEDHIVVLGYGDLTEPILDELIGAAEFVVVTPDQEKAARLQQRDISVLTDDPSDEAPLERVGIHEARAVVAATNDDAQDALSILTARAMNPDINIVAAATDRENVEKLRRAGADTVISPAVIGGHLLVQSALGRAGMEHVADHLLEMRGEEED